MGHNRQVDSPGIASKTEDARGKRGKREGRCAVAEKMALFICLTIKHG